MEPEDADSVAQIEKDRKKTVSQNLGNIMLGLGTFAGIVSLGFLALKNLSKSKAHLKEGLNIAKDTISKIVESSTGKTKEIDKGNLEAMFRSIEGSDGVENFIEKEIKKLKWENKDEKTEFLNNILTQMRTSTTKATPNEAM